MQVLNVLHEARWKYRTQKWRKNRHLGTIAQLCRAVSSQLHVSTIGKKLLNINMSSTRLHNPTNGWDRSGVWGTRATFNGFHVLAALLHGTQVVGISETLRHGARNGITELSQRASPIFGYTLLEKLVNVRKIRHDTSVKVTEQVPYSFFPLV